VNAARATGKERDAMSSIISKQPKDTRKQTTVSLSGSVLAELELYCQFIDSSRDWVINEALKSVFRRDRAFLTWKDKQPTAPAAVASLAGRPEKAKPQRESTAPVPPAA
jgi:hypothetical protein